MFQKRRIRFRISATKKQNRNSNATKKKSATKSRNSMILFRFNRISDFWHGNFLHIFELNFNTNFHSYWSIIFWLIEIEYNVVLLFCFRHLLVNYSWRAAVEDGTKEKNARRWFDWKIFHIFFEWECLCACKWIDIRWWMLRVDFTLLSTRLQCVNKSVYIRFPNGSIILCSIYRYTCGYR